MFATLTSFLPSLQLERGKDSPTNHTGDGESADSPASTRTHDDIPLPPAEAPIPYRPKSASALPKPSSSSVERNTPRPRRPKPEKPLGETYIIVRPPPAKNNHPLNLQIQLVPPRQRDSASRSATLVSQRQSGEYANVNIDAQAPSSQTPSPTTSASSNAGTNPPSHDLVRVASIRSNYSDRSAGFYASTVNASSVNSFASTTSTVGAGAPRRIVPLYNLSAHNVMTNYIADAGTDTKIAKFQRRGLEVICVGTWEPVEVWSSYTRRVSRTSSIVPFDEPTHGPERNTTLLSGGSVLGTDVFVRDSSLSPHLPVPRTPEAGSNEKSPSLYYRDLPPSPMPPPSANAAKRFFGKVFKKNKNGEASGDKSLPTSPEPSSEFFSRGKRPPAYINSVPSRMSPQPGIFSGRSGHSRKRSASYSHDPILQPPILGLQAALHSSHPPHPTGRPRSYIWCLRKWAKEKQLNPESLLKGLAVGLQSLNLNSSDSHEKKSKKDSNVIDTSLTGDIEVRFEWSRGKSAASKGRGRQATLGLKGSSNPTLSFFIENDIGLPSAAEGNGMKDIETMSSAHSNHSIGSFHSNMVQPSPRRAQVHLSTSGLGVGTVRSGDSEASPRSPYQRRSPTISRDDHAVVTDADDGVDSDPEDSETPWTCTLHVYPSHLSPLTEREMKERALLQSASDPHTNPSSSSMAPPLLPADGRIRIKLAVLVPTPHHPKILGQFKLPFPLPDVAITPNASSSLSYLQSAQFSSSPNPNSPVPIALQRYQSGMGARFLPRTLAPDGSILHAAEREGEMNMNTEVLLTAEDIKDVVSSTGLWLCVREGFGGLGRTKRKGDGWHIRA